MTLPTFGPNVSGAPASTLDHHGDKGPVFFDDVVSTEPRKREKKPVVVPEPLKRVRVLRPFQVVYKGDVFLPDSVAEVPESLADNWILNQWVEQVAGEILPPKRRTR